MKEKITIMLLMFLTSISFGQTVTHSEIGTTVLKGKFMSYISKDGSEYKVGDKINIGTGSGINSNFVFIQLVDIMGTVSQPPAHVANTQAEIKNIHVYGNKRMGYKLHLQTKAMSGLHNYFLYLEDAIDAREVKSFGMTSDEALTQLKRAKDKLDLGLITQEEFNIKKEELSKHIK
jgi:hypothetical protein